MVSHLPRWAAGWTDPRRRRGVQRLLAEVESILDPMVMLKTYDEDVLAATYRHPLCMIGSGCNRAPAPDGPLAGEVFLWRVYLGRVDHHWRMVREPWALAPEQAIFRLTGLPARTLGLADRGVLRPGAHADIIAFDPLRFGGSGDDCRT